MVRLIVILALAEAAAGFGLVAPAMRAHAVSRPAAARAVPAALPRLAKVHMADDAAAAVADPEPEKDSLMESLTTGSFFALWYLFNIGYNIYNKKALNALPIPYTIAALQLAVGVPYCFFLWMTGLRKAPKLSPENVKTLIPVSLGHLGTHIGAVVSLGAGAVSFTHIIKASEPVVSAALSFVFLGAVSSWQTYLTLLPIVGGVALASLKELSFTWVGFIAAMGSNLSSAMRYAGTLNRRTPAHPTARRLPTAVSSRPPDCSAPPARLQCSAPRPPPHDRVAPAREPTRRALSACVPYAAVGGGVVRTALRPRPRFCFARLFALLQRYLGQEDDGRRRRGEHDGG